MPHRKVSIYTEGCLIAFICDQRIKRLTKGERGLDDVMKLLYVDHGLQNIGYTESDYLFALEEVGETSFRDVYDQLIHGTEDYTPFLVEAFETSGIEWTQLELSVPETFWGLRGTPGPEGIHVIGIHPGSPCETGGLWYGDVILSIDKQEPDKDWKLNLPKNEKVELEVKRNGSILRINLTIDLNKTFFKGQRLIISE